MDTEKEEYLSREERFEVALSLKLGIPLSRLKEELSHREYIAYQKYYSQIGFGEESAFLRSANLIITLVQQIHGAMGGKAPKLSLDDIYPQLSLKRKNNGKNLIKWEDTPDRMKKQLIMTGLFDEDGNPQGYNPHS
jgi:hypothetical protein